MKKQERKLFIVGAGISGLIAAHVLEGHGYSPVIIDSNDRVGGRVKTDVIDGYQLDHGFQVLLDAYPAVQKYLDLEQLEVQKYAPGACIFISGKKYLIGDPFRDISLLIPTIFSKLGTFSDKLNVLKLNYHLKNKTVDDIFNRKENTTLEYLKETGFSENFINEFFMPFFAGIFLEDDLNTSSRMFEFVYKMFGKGLAVVPKSGMEAIPKQLSQKLERTTFMFNEEVSFIKDGELTLSSGQKLTSHYTIVATEASHLIKSLRKQSVTWRSCDTLYYEVDSTVNSKALIGLVPDRDILINNICYPTLLATESKPRKHLLSVTIVKRHHLSSVDLVQQVAKELKEHCSITILRFIKHYNIPKALPKLNNLQYEMSPSETRLTSTIFLAGDTQLNASLNAAMIAGERAAMAVVETINKRH
ncbi:FAD-dependent oxidoreductase [Lutimonas sp.]|uniref:FAD-dependent oxidoreductase n=1 Tax=Lutimonas sp. TaxID=1872403 RepID=UPI003D9B0C5E